MKEFLLEHYSIITKSVELIAAISGSLYLRKNKNSVLKIFVFYLWLTFVTELIGEYPHILQNNYNYEWFRKLKNSVFCYNMWMYNIYSYIAIGLLGIFYSNLMTSKAFKNVIIIVFIVYSLCAFIYYTFTDAFFLRALPYDFLLGTVAICLFVILYFIELMRSDEILTYYKLPSFYISVALFLWYICVSPLFIFDSYFLEINTDFISFRRLYLLIINIITYLCFAFGFWYSLKLSKR